MGHSSLLYCSWLYVFGWVGCGFPQWVVTLFMVEVCVCFCWGGLIYVQFAVVGVFGSIFVAVMLSFWYFIDSGNLVWFYMI